MIFMVSKHVMSGERLSLLIRENGYRFGSKVGYLGIRVVDDFKTIILYAFAEVNVLVKKQKIFVK